MVFFKLRHNIFIYLLHPNLKKEYYLETAVCDKAIGRHLVLDNRLKADYKGFPI